MRRGGQALRRRYGRMKNCAGASNVQSLLFPRSAFTISAARSWAADHGYRHTSVDVADKFIRLRQRDPRDFGRLRTVEFGGRILAVVGWEHC